MLDAQTIDALDALDNVDDGYQHDITKILPTDYVVTEIADYQNNSSELIDVYIDIETIPGAFMPDISDLKVPANYKNSKTIQKWIEENHEKEYRKQALNSMKGRILCIGVAINDNDPFVITGHTERSMMQQLDNLTSGMTNYRFIGHYTKQFDYMWLYHRAVKYGCKYLAQNIRDNRQHVDLREKSGGFLDYKFTVSLDALCKFFEIDTPKGAVTGSNVYEYWMRGEVDEVFKYCAKDIVATRDVSKFLLQW